MKPTSVLMTAAVAGLIAGGTMTLIAAPAFAKDKVDCYNTCKGKGGCKTDAHACKGKNACKGQGKVMHMSAEKCTGARWTQKNPADDAGAAAPAPAQGAQ